VAPPPPSNPQQRQKGIQPGGVSSRNRAQKNRRSLRCGGFL
jgi:hypothetical protein